MPELPEVQTIATQLNNKLAGLKFDTVEVLNDGSFIGAKDLLVGTDIVSVTRRAKTIIFTFPEDLYMLIHLKMTGQLIYVDHGERVAGGHPSHEFHATLPTKHTRVIFSLSNGATLYFNDVRKFGWCRLVNSEEMSKYFSTYGPDATPRIDSSYLELRASRKKNSMIKKFILDQNVLSGIGNIYADEILYELKIHPETLVSKLKHKDWELLADMIDQKLRFAIEKGGTSDNDYVNANGEKGGMQDFLNVYHKTGSPCPNDCGGVIERIVVGGRGTHYCPKCQKVKK